jgi:phosphoribosyl 1,2-cyclic phosphodiesterase
MMRLIFWGTRGGVPVSNSSCLRHGGATTCIEVQLDAGSGTGPNRVIFDCGTGLAEMGRSAGPCLERALILQTHMHWDHIQGFPFWGPLFNPAAIIDLWAVRREGLGLRDVLSRQMCRPTFPVGLEILPATLRFEDLPAAGSRKVGELELSWIELDHPGGVTAYRLEHRGTSLVFTGDVEVSMGCRERLVRFARGADALIMDAQYFPEEYPSRRGFGHSTVFDAVDVAVEAGVRRLLMTHHDPTHDDGKLDDKLAMARRRAGRRLLVDNAYDGLRVELGGEAYGVEELPIAL